MADTPARRYGDRDVALIIQRAVELQQREPGDGDAPTGMSLAELEQIAKETGLDPRFIRRAAADLDAQALQKPPSRLLGAPRELHFERTLEGELSPELYEPIVEEIRRVLGDTGFGSTLGRTLTWTSTVAAGGRGRDHGRHVSVTVSPRRGHTTIRIEESLRHFVQAVLAATMAGGGMGISLAMGVGMGALHSVAAAVGIWCGLVGGAHLLSRTVFTKKARDHERQLRLLLDRLVELIEREEGGGRREAVGPAGAPPPSLLPPPSP